MTVNTIDETWGRVRAVELLERTAKWAETEVAEGNWRIFDLRNLGELATIANRAEIRATVLRLLAGVPDEAFTAGLVTNISDRSRFIQRQLPDAATAARSWPTYERNQLFDYASRMGNVERLTLDGRLAEAEAIAKDDFAIECYVATRALMGDFEEALALMNAPSYPKNRKYGPFIVACVESYRAGNHDLSWALVQQRWPTGKPGCFIHLAAGYLGLVPWGGYPYADY